MSDNGDEKIRLADDEKRQIDRLNRAGESVQSIADSLGVPPEVVRKYLQKAAKDRASKLPTAVFFIGLALTLFPGTPIGFWPGILFVFAAVALANGLSKGRLKGELKSAAWLSGIGLIFWLNFSLPLLLILIGLASLFGIFARSSRENTEEKERKRRQMREGLREAGRAIREGIWGTDDANEKRKNDERRDRDEDEGDRQYEKPKRGAMRLSDDGELIEIMDEGEDEARQRRS